MRRVLGWLRRLLYPALWHHLGVCRGLSVGRCISGVPLRAGGHGH